jgi:MarR family transcriptional regulator, multiple antibiotic resistance protein MarR
MVSYEVALWTAVDHELARQGRINLGQLHALRVVRRYDGRVRVQDLSGDIGITVGAASKLVDRLERDGLATRSPNPANRRSSLIELTDAGHQALISAMDVFSTAVAIAVSGEDVDLLTEALQRLQTQLDRSGVGLAA